MSLRLSRDQRTAVSVGDDRASWSGTWGKTGSSAVRFSPGTAGAGRPSFSGHRPRLHRWRQVRPGPDWPVPGHRPPRSRGNGLRRPVLSQAMGRPDRRAARRARRTSWSPILSSAPDGPGPGDPGRPTLTLRAVACLGGARTRRRRGDRHAPGRPLRTADRSHHAGQAEGERRSGRGTALDPGRARDRRQGLRGAVVVVDARVRLTGRIETRSASESRDLAGRPTRRRGTRATGS